MPPITRSIARKEGSGFAPQSSRGLSLAIFEDTNVDEADQVETPIEGRPSIKGKAGIFQDVTNSSNTPGKCGILKKGRFSKTPPPPRRSLVCLESAPELQIPKPQPQENLDNEDFEFSPETIELLDEIGGGAQSLVFRGKRKRDEAIFAIKVIDYNCNRKYADRELAIHQSLDSPGVVQLHGHYRESSKHHEKLCLVLEYCPKTLKDVVKDHTDGRLPEDLASQYTLEILEALEYLHRNQIIHRDIKLGNILLSEEGKIKIADFGISTNDRNPENRKTIIGTEGYMAPEIEDNTMESERGAKFLQRARESGPSAVFNNIPTDVDLYDTHYDAKVDIFSLGTTLYGMLTGRLPEDSETEFNSDFDLCFDAGRDGAHFDFDLAQEILSLDALDLILAMLDEDPSARISLEEIRCHPWIQKGGL